MRILLASAPVQGPDAAERMVRALNLLAQVRGIDCVIIGRGGGSAEDLAPYHDEQLVRRIASMPVPVVSAVGHEIDTSLADLAADKRAATPSQAAELVIRDNEARQRALRDARVRLGRAMKHELARRAQRVDDLAGDLQSSVLRGAARRRAAIATLERRLQGRHPSAVLAAARARTTPLEARLSRAMGRRLERARTGVARDAARLDAMSPLAVLGRGYAIALREGRAVRDAAEVSPGDALSIRVHRGTVVADVRSVRMEDES